MTAPQSINFQSKLKSLRLFGLTITELHNLLRFLIRRIADNELTQVAGNLTFITVLAFVPLLTIAFAIFTAFPIFNHFREALEAYFIRNLMPHALSNNILGYLNQFAAKATTLSAYGAIALVVTAVATLALIERAFNQIWRVKQRRSLIKRALVYWALFTLAPLLIGISLTVTSYLLTMTFASTTDVVKVIPGGQMIYRLASLIFTTGAFSLLYTVVPNRRVEWRDAVWGGLIAGILFEFAKFSFAKFVIHIPTYTIVYGALAVIPLFLIWIYTSWLIILFGAVVTALLPIVKYERWWHVPKPGSYFIDAMAVLEALYSARTKTNRAGISSWEIRQQTGLGFDEIENLLVQMMHVGWVGRLGPNEAKTSLPLFGAERWVLLANPSLISVSQVYRLFLFDLQLGAADTHLMKLVESAIEQGLQESLEGYFLAS